MKDVTVRPARTRSPSAKKTGPRRIGARTIRQRQRQLELEAAVRGRVQKAVDSGDPAALEALYEELVMGRGRYGYHGRSHKNIIVRSLARSKAARRHEAVMRWVEQILGQKQEQAPPPPPPPPMFVDYEPRSGIQEFARKVGDAEPLLLAETERRGVPGRLLKDLAVWIGVPNIRLFGMLGVPKATAERKIASNGLLSGAGGSAVLAMLKLLDLAQRIVDNSTADDADGFDTARWFGRWIEMPQPALGGKKPGELLDTPTGAVTVGNVLRAMESGVYL